MHLPMTTISCPNCHKPINIDDALRHQLKEQLQGDFQKEKEQLTQQHLDLQKKLVLLTTQKDHELKQKEEQVKQELWSKAQAEALKKVQASYNDKNDKVRSDLELQLKEQQERAQKAEIAEIEIRKKQRVLEEERKQQELILERRLDEKLKKELEIRDKTQSESFHQKELEYLKQIQDMRQSVEAAQRKASTVSQQLQGEVRELELEELLTREYPQDTIKEVKKGQRGADIIQEVRTPTGQLVGIIVWESKQTGEFKDSWLTKLREDARAVHGEICVLVSNILPPDIQICSQRDGVWITKFEFAVPLSILLRHTLLRVNLEKGTQKGKDIKSEMLFQYISGHEFRSRIEAIVESFKEMQTDIDSEQRLMQAHWKKREKQVIRLATNTAYMYGEMQGIIGSSMPIVSGLDIGQVSQSPKLETPTSPKMITSEDTLFTV